MKVKVGDGGTVARGQTFDWENNSANQVSITNCSSFLTLSSYSVPGKSTTTPATVRSDIQPGEYTYSESNNTTGTNPKMSVT